MLKVSELIASYMKGVVVLERVSMEARRGEITVVIGPNGAGKSTLLKAIYGFIKPTSGTIFFDGREITGGKPHKLLRMGMAYLTQEREVFPEMSVEENLKLGAWLFKNDRKRVAAALESVYQHYPFLLKRRSQKAGSLSGGEQRMLELGRLLMVEPKLILLDEPTAGLAPKVAREIYSEISRLKERGLTILLVDQNIKAAVQLADYIYVLEMGRVATSGSKEELSVKVPELVKSWLTQTSG
ncbi:MAG: ABC transporter ATP-binding protein [Candidatus Caldarchaeum sp.]|uniref:ABC transporter ATP-binding protein n=1 Tax=Caldiarchaeum subterraneum TaxID=311458 RepID=A0A7C5QQP1_CALS0